MDHRNPPSVPEPGKGFWFFLVWVAACWGVYLWKIPPHPFLSFKFFFLSFQYSQWTWPQILEVWAAHFLWALSLVGTMVVLLGAGNLLLRLLDVDLFSSIEKWVWSLALGLAFWGILAQGLAFEKLFYADLMRGLVALAALLFLVIDRKEALLRCWPFREIIGMPASWKWPIALTAFFSLANLLAPEMSWDAITYQLILPKFYFMSHGFYPVTGIVPAHYPSLGQMFFSWGFLWGSDSLARSLCFLAHAGTALALVGIGTRLDSPKCGWTAAVLYWVFPIFNIFSTRGYVDLFTGFYVVLGLGYLLLFVRPTAAPDARTPEKHLFGFLGLLALSVVWGLKYTAPSFWIAGIAVLVLGSSGVRPTRSLWVFSLLGPFFFFLPWMLKGWAYVHNPVFPYLHGWFGSFGWSDRDQALWEAKFPVEGIEGLLKVPLLPWKIFFENHTGAPNEEVSLVFLAFLPLLFLGGTSARGKWPLVAAVAVPLLFWSVTSQQLRLVSGIVALLSLLFALGYQRALARWARHAWAIRGSLLILLWTCAFYLFQGLIQQPNPFANFLGFQSREQFLDGILMPRGYIKLARHMNGELPPEARVLILGQQNGYYLDRISSYDFDSTFPILKNWSERSTDPEGLYRQFRKNGFTHILYNAGAMMGTAVRVEELGQDRYPWKPEELRNYEQFLLKYTRKVPLPVEGYSLYEVGPREGFSPPPENLPGTESYYLRSMRELMGLSKMKEMIGRKVPQEVYLKAYQRVAEQHPEIGYPCFQWAFAELALHPGSAEGVLKKVEEGFRRNGDKASLLTLSGDIFLARNKPRKAIPLLEKAKELSPEREDVARNLAAAYYNEHRLELAAREAERAAALAPFSTEYSELARQLRAAVTLK